MITDKPEVVVYRYTASRSFGKRNWKWHYQESPPVVGSRMVHGIGQMEQLIRLSDYEALQAECEKLRKDADRYRWLREQHNGPLDLVIATVGSWSLESWSGDDPDAAIDAAMQEPGQ